jgi:nicotinamidase-related amidase
MADAAESVTEALVVLDVITTFEHDDGDRLLESMRGSVPPLVRALARARGRMAVIYVNDAAGRWDGDAPGHIERALAGKGGDILRDVMPRSGDLVLFKPNYSAFDGTTLAHLLDESGVNRVVLAGAATEMCVAQTGIAARASGYQVTVLRDACATVDKENERISLAYLEHVTGSVVRDADDWILRG